jgi:hypothetical protein
MSKRNNRAVVSSVALVCVLCAGLAWGRPGAAQTARPAVTVNPKSAAVREATAEVLRETSALRQLKVLRTVESGAQSRPDIERMLIENLNESTSPEEMRVSELALKKFGLAPPEFQLRPLIIAVLTEQIAGYYSPKAQTFYLADWINPDGLKPIIAHELTHALQDQHFNLRRFENWPKHDSDAELAAQALVEGDATVLMMQYAAQDPARGLALFKAMGQSSTVQLDSAPHALRETLMFPYVVGMTWAAQVHRKGGWQLITRAYTDLPKSTEQIMHPEKYFAREEPVREIAWQDVSAVLGKGWRVTDYDVSGEWGYYLILDEHLKSRADSMKAAAGWGGDRYVLYEGPGRADALLVQYTQWDTEEDAAEFFDAYVRRTDRRYKQLGGARLAPEAAATRAAWTTTEGGVVVERRGPRVLMAEGLPKNTKPELLAKLFP